MAYWFRGISDMGTNAKEDIVLSWDSWCREDNPFCDYYRWFEYTVSGRGRHWHCVPLLQLPAARWTEGRELAASLLKQLCQERASLSDSVKVLYKKHKVKRTRPSFDEISKTLQSVTTMFSKVFIVIDALDECQTTDGCRTRLLTEIFLAQAKSRANVFATSRFLPEVIERFEGSISLEIRASKEDVRRYLDGCMFRLPAFVGRSPDLQEEIKTGIVSLVKGMWVPQCSPYIRRCSNLFKGSSLHNSILIPWLERDQLKLSEPLLRNYLQEQIYMIVHITTQWTVSKGSYKTRKY